MIGVSTQRKAVASAKKGTVAYAKVREDFLQLKMKLAASISDSGSFPVGPRHAAIAKELQREVDEHQVGQMWVVACVRACVRGAYPMSWPSAR